MLIDLTCPAEVFETTLPTEEIPAVGLSLYNLSDRVIVTAEVTLKLLSGSGAEKERVVYRARALNGRPHSTFRMNVPCPHHASARSAEAYDAPSAEHTLVSALPTSRDRLKGSNLVGL